METIRSLLARHSQLSNTDTARLDCELLLAHVLKKERAYLYTWPEKEVNIDHIIRYESLFNRRKKGEPIAYIIGVQEFWSLPIKVNGSTLIPRPETECLVEISLALFNDTTLDQKHALDLGAGTGAIALALASERPHWQVLGLEKIPEALLLAEENRRLLAIDNAKFRLSDWYDGLAANEYFDLIVSNPPYIDCDDEHLNQGDVRFEPRSALVAANKGLNDIQSIIHGAKTHLKPGGYLVLEHGYQQASNVRALLSAAGFLDVVSHDDYAGQPRVSLGRCAS